MNTTSLLVEQYELVKETRFVFDSDVPTVVGRIYRIIKGVNAIFTWELNYYCRLCNEVEVYIPSSPFGDTLNSVEEQLHKYLKRFETAVSWSENKYY